MEWSGQITIIPKPQWFGHFGEDFQVCPILWEFPTHKNWSLWNSSRKNNSTQLQEFWTFINNASSWRITLPWKLTYTINIPIFNRKIHLDQPLIFRGHVSFRGGNILNHFEPQKWRFLPMNPSGTRLFSAMYRGPMSLHNDRLVAYLVFPIFSFSNS